MIIMLVGGGSGGHIMPLLAIAKHLKLKNPEVRIVAVTERRGKFTGLFDSPENIDEIRFISAGKLRRFHGESWWVRASDIHRNLLNLRDSLRLLAGCLQSFWLLVRHRPQIIFIKGGYVGVPIGLAAWLLRIPYVTHDSDALAGLSNRLIGRGATLHTVGMPKDTYTYPAEKTIFVGIPVGDDFGFLDPKKTNQAKAKLGIPPDAQVLMVTGGSNGARRLNTAMDKIAKQLLESNDNLWIIHQFGQGNERLYGQYPASLKKRIIAEPFLAPLSDYSAAADLIVTRAGATTLAEFAAQSKACVVVPNPYLTGGHQLQNAKALEKTGSIAVLLEKSMEDSLETARLLQELLSAPDERSRMAASLHETMPPNAAEKLAGILLVHASKPQRHS